MPGSIGGGAGVFTGAHGLSGSGVPCGCRDQSTNPEGSGARGARGGSDLRRAERARSDTSARKASALRDVEVGQHRRDRAGRRARRAPSPGRAGDSSQPWRRVSDWMRACGTAIARRVSRPLRSSTAEAHVEPAVAPPRQRVEPPGRGGPARASRGPRRRRARRRPRRLPGTPGATRASTSRASSSVPTGSRVVSRWPSPSPLAAGAGDVDPDPPPARPAATTAAARARGPGCGAAGWSSRAGRSAPPARARRCRRRRGGSCRG